MSFSHIRVLITFMFFKNNSLIFYSNPTWSSYVVMLFSILLVFFVIFFSRTSFISIIRSTSLLTFTTLFSIVCQPLLLSISMFSFFVTHYRYHVFLFSLYFFRDHFFVLSMFLNFLLNHSTH